MAPILKTALTYPLTNRFRTGVTLAMFTLVVFTLVVGGTATTAFTAPSTTWSCTAAASTSAPAPYGQPDYRPQYGDRPVPDAESQRLRRDRGAEPCRRSRRSRTAAAATSADYPLRGVDDAFLDNNTYGFAAHRPRLRLGEGRLAGAEGDPNLAVVDGLVAPLREHFDFGAPAPDFQLEGFYLEDGTFKATPIVLRDPQTGDEHS